MTPASGIREAAATYGELALVEQPAIDLLTELGWEHADLFSETFGERGTEGRESEHQVILTRRLRAALEKLNPGLSEDSYTQAVEILTQDRSKQLPVNANRDLYRLLKDGVRVTTRDERGDEVTQTLRIIDWNTPGNNEFFLASQMWVAGDMYRRRCDLLGFVNGLPLVFIELKKPSIPLKSAFDDILCDESGRIGQKVDTGDRWLRRIFNDASLMRGGRLYGGFWMPMSSEDRLRHLYINQEPVAALDYGQCAVRIAYGMADATMPKGDLYSVPRLEHYRDGIKLVLSSMFFSEAPLKRKPRGSVKLLPKHYTIGEVQERIRAHHEPISRYFHKDFGMFGQCIESSILVRCLLTLMDRGIVALPVHDCLVVPKSAVEETKRVMLDSFREVAGAEAEVDTKVLNQATRYSEDF